MKILICDRQRMLAEALASALDARRYNVLAVTTAVSDALSAVDDSPGFRLIRGFWRHSPGEDAGQQAGS
jgi:DNA-binding response OmpR family regulator